MNSRVINVNNALEIALYVLEQCNGIAHHTTITEYASRHGLNPNNFDLATKIWSDAKKESSQFIFLNSGCFCLKSYTGSRDTKSLVPQRKSRNSTADDIVAKIAKLEDELSKLRAQLREVTNNGK